MKKEFVIADVLPGKLNALVKNMMVQMGVTDANEAVRRFNAKEWVLSKPAKRWREVDGVIYLTVTLDKPTTGDEWIPRTKKKGNRAGDYAKSVLRSENFKSSDAGTYEVVILKSLLFEDDDRITQKIRAKADEMKLVKPNADIACLIREQFTDKEIGAMGLCCIVTMHEPIDSEGNLGLLTAYRDEGGRWLFACDGDPGFRWNWWYGFAFLAPQVP